MIIDCFAPRNDSCVTFAFGADSAHLGATVTTPSNATDSNTLPIIGFTIVMHRVHN